MAIEEALVKVEVELHRQTAELSGAMLEVCRYATHGGRRIRAALLLASGQQWDDRAIRAAAAIELIHAATLLQDDIFDAGVLRRGRPAAHMRFGRAMTILASDWLLIRSLEMAADIHLDYFRRLARAGTSMVQAEVNEFTPPRFESTEQAYEYSCEIARDKTAVLFGVAMCGGAILRDLASASIRQWEESGMRLGLTYQIADDCMDVYGSETTSDKTVGADLEAGRLTLPVLFAVARLQQRGARVSLEALQAGSLHELDRLRLKDELQSAEVKASLRAVLEQRIAEHRNEVGIPSAVLETCFEDLQEKLGTCTPLTSILPHRSVLEATRSTVRQQGYV